MQRRNFSPGVLAPVCKGERVGAPVFGCQVGLRLYTAGFVSLLRVSCLQPPPCVDRSKQAPICDILA